MKKLFCLIVLLTANIGSSFAINNNINESYIKIDNEINAKKNEMNLIRQDNKINEHEKMIRLNNLRKEEAELIDKKIQTNRNYQKEMIELNNY